MGSRLAERAPIAAACVGLMLAGAALAQPRVPAGGSSRGSQRGSTRGSPQVAEVPLENGAALASFARALQALELGPSTLQTDPSRALRIQHGPARPCGADGAPPRFGAPCSDPAPRVRVLHYGDSNVAADLWTAVARRALSARYGEGGSGYLLPAGHGSAHRGAVRVTPHGAWGTRRHGYARPFGPEDGLWGLAGVAAEAEAPGARIEIEIPDAGGAPRELALHLLGRPGGGAIELRVGEGVPERVELTQAAPGLVLLRRALAPGAQRVRVVAVRGRARVLGVSVEREGGLVYDVLGINGHRASAILRWNEDLLRAQLEQRRPDLIVLSYGGNEALTADLPIATYEERTYRAVGRLRGLAPHASCLLVGPLATFPEHEARMRAVTAVQRRIAPALGCAFWDSSRASGGHGRLDRWARFPGMVSGDRLHLGRQGYERVGEVFVRALLTEVDRAPP